MLEKNLQRKNIKSSSDNTRPLEDALTSEVERLRTALMMLKPEYFRDEKQTAAMELIAVALRGEE